MQDDACFTLPGALDIDGLVTVGASDANNVMSGRDGAGTNFGPCVDIFAPGEKVWSALTSHEVMPPDPPESMYVEYSGTSMATPLTAGMIARYVEALGADASVRDAKNAMYHAAATAIKPNSDAEAWGLEPCPTNTMLIQTPVTVDSFDTSDIFPGSGDKQRVGTLKRRGVAATRLDVPARAHGPVL